jgi:ribosome biogenesis protein Tsr3
MGYLYEACDQISDFCHQYLLRKKCNEKCAYMFNVNKNQQSRQTGSRNLMGPKTLPTIWDTDMKLVTKYQICVINSCWEKCNEKWAYMFNVNKNQQCRQTGSRNLTGPKTLPTIWYTYMKLVTKYQISAIDSCWEKCDEKYLGRTDRQTDRGKTVYPPPPPGSGGIIKFVSDLRQFGDYLLVLQFPPPIKLTSTI